MIYIIYIRSVIYTIYIYVVLDQPPQHEHSHKSFVPRLLLIVYCDAVLRGLQFTIQRQHLLKQPCVLTIQLQSRPSEQTLNPEARDSTLAECTRDQVTHSATARCCCCW